MKKLIGHFLEPICFSNNFLDSFAKLCFKGFTATSGQDFGASDFCNLT